MIVEIADEEDKENNWHVFNRHIINGSSEVIDADPEDPLRITISSRPSREGG